MKFRRLSIALLFGIGLVIFSLTATTYRPIQAQATCDRYVLGIDASDSTDCSDAHHPCRTIQYAIDQAIDTTRDMLHDLETAVKSDTHTSRFNTMCNGLSRLRSRVV